MNTFIFSWYSSMWISFPRRTRNSLKRNVFTWHDSAVWCLYERKALSRVRLLKVLYQWKGIESSHKTHTNKWTMNYLNAAQSTPEHKCSGLKELKGISYICLFPPSVTNQNGWCSCRSSRRQEGTSKIQAEDHSHFQEQGTQTRPEGVRKIQSPRGVHSM